jgi:hypothetical protein
MKRSEEVGALSQQSSPYKQNDARRFVTSWAMCLYWSDATFNCSAGKKEKLSSWGENKTALQTEKFSTYFHKV